MKIEVLEELTSRYMKKMQSRVNGEDAEIIKQEFMSEYRMMIKEFIRLHPIFERYQEEFEIDLMPKEMSLSAETVLDKTYKRIEHIKQDIEKEENIMKIEQKETLKNEEKSVNHRRRERIQETLNEMVQRVNKHIMRREIYIDWAELRPYQNRIIDKYADSIESNVFEKSERVMIQKGVQKYIEEVKEELLKDKRQDKEVAFKEGPVCPVVTNQDAFAIKTKEIVKESTEKEERQGEVSRDLPGNILE